MKNSLIIISILIASSAFAQFSPKTFTKVDGVLLMGQSNADRFYSYTSTGFESALKTMWAKDTAYVIPVVKGGTYLAAVGGANDWNVSSTGELYDSIIIRMNGIYKASPLGRWEPEYNGNKTGTGHSALSQYRRANNTVVNIRCAVWIQGENDSQGLTEANAYEANLTAFIAGVRAKLNKPNLPFFVVGLGGCYAGPYKATINTAMTNVAAADAYVEYISLTDLDCTYYHADQVHYAHSGAAGTAGYEVRTRIAALITSKGW